MTLLDRVRAAGNETPAASRATRDEMLEWLKERVREQLPADDIASLAKGNPERARGLPGSIRGKRPLRYRPCGAGSARRHPDRFHAGLRASRTFSRG